MIKYLPMKRLITKLLFVSLMLGLAACQSSQSILDAGEQNLTESQQVYGDGDILIGLVVPATDPSGQDMLVQDYVDGAKLGLDLLGQNQLKLHIHRTDGSTKSAVRAVQDLSAANARLILGPSDEDDLLKMNANTKVPILAFVGNSSHAHQGAFSVLSDSILQVNEAARATIEAGKTDFVVLHSETSNLEDVQRVITHITTQKGKVAAKFSYDSKAKNVLATLNQNSKSLGQADAIIVLGSDKEVKFLLDSMLKNKLRPNTLLLLERRTFDALNPKDPAYEGVIFSILPLAENKTISSKFKEENKRVFSKAAAYGFDLLALAAGLNHIGKLKSQAMSALTDQKGFSGLYGHFRFHKSGSVERRMRIQQVRDSKITILQETGDGF